jgi:hypothetical protein
MIHQLHSTLFPPHQTANVPCYVSRPVVDLAYAVAHL